jgi:hypothetical protein
VNLTWKIWWKVNELDGHFRLQLMLHFHVEATQFIDPIEFAQILGMEGHDQSGTQEHPLGLRMPRVVEPTGVEIQPDLGIPGPVVCRLIVRGAGTALGII